jgi:O-antigen ligase
MDNWRASLHDLIELTPLRWLLHSRHGWLTPLVGLLLAAGLAVGCGWLVAEVGILPVAALLLVTGVALWMLIDIEVAYWAVIGIVTLLPFGSLPFSIGFTPTFLDLALLGLFFVWLAPIALGQQRLDLTTTPLGLPILLFALLAVGAFVAGLSHGALTSYLIRHFAEILLSIALFFLIVNTVRSRDRLTRLTRFLLLCAGAAAALGILLYVIPEESAMRALSALGRFGYPTGPGVIWHIRDDPELMKRATSTSVHPNILGSLLNLSLVLATPQLFAKRPIFKRLILLPLLGLIGVGLVLTISRGSMVGAAVGVFILAALRYRKLLPLLALALVLILVLPWTQELVTHFIEGLQGEDLSTKMRFGEYKDALILIRRYPLLGVGFAGAPDIDIYVAVANIYLLIAAQMGLVGLAGFLLVIGILLARFWRHRNHTSPYPHLEPLWFGYHAALIAGLVGGVFDHYFFSLDFHHSVTIFWMFLGLATATTELLERRLAQEAA